MPLTRLQRVVLGLLAANRDPESFVAGSTYMTRSGARVSADIDIFHDQDDRLVQVAEADAAALVAGGIRVEWRRRHPQFLQAVVTQGEDSTRIEWVVDSDFRFYPAQPDPEFGYVLHPADLATNKVWAAAGRREPRDVVDLLEFHDTVLPLGAIAWAAVGRALGFTPEGLLNEVSRLARYREDDFHGIASDPPVDAAEVMRRLREALAHANDHVRRMPTDLAGCLFLEGGKIVQPDPAQLGRYAQHRPSRRGHWPGSPEIGHAMMERYRDR